MKKPPVIVMQLVHMEGPMKGQIQEFNQPEILIGRSATCHVCFPKDLAIVSRMHARIVREGNRFMLMDQSSNGTYVNGKQMKEAMLKDGDILLFAEGGPKVSFLTQTLEGVSEVSDSVQPVAFSTSMVPPQPVVESPPPSPMPHPERVAVAPQSSILSVSQPPQPAQHSGQIAIQQVNKPLVIQYGPTLKSYNGLPVTIGSGVQCDFRLDHPGVMERHAQIYYDQELYWIKDLTGKNQLRINGRSVDGQGMLEPDHRLSLSTQGPDFRFLGGGRLAEIEPDALEDSPASPHPDGGGENPDMSQRNPVKQIGAMMKKILKR